MQYNKTMFREVQLKALLEGKRILIAGYGREGRSAESLIKRSVGIKDSSSRFPGMGGILDILDSLLFSAPFMYAYVVWFF